MATADVWLMLPRLITVQNNVATYASTAGRRAHSHGSTRQDSSEQAPKRNCDTTEMTVVSIGGVSAGDDEAA